jgi:hypothetical protein
MIEVNVKIAKCKLPSAPIASRRPVEVKVAIGIAPLLTGMQALRGMALVAATKGRP